MTGEHEPEHEPEEAAQVAAAMSVWLRRGAMAVAVSRVGVGVVAFAAPGLVSRSWTGGAGDGPSGQVPASTRTGPGPSTRAGSRRPRICALGLGALAGAAAPGGAEPGLDLGRRDVHRPGKAGIRRRLPGLAAGMWVGLAALADGLDLVTTAVS